MAPPPGPVTAVVVTCIAVMGAWSPWSPLRTAARPEPLPEAPAPLEAANESTPVSFSSDDSAADDTRPAILSRWSAAVPNWILEVVADVEMPQLTDSSLTQKVLLAACCLFCGVATLACLQWLRYLPMKLRSSPSCMQEADGDSAADLQTKAAAGPVTAQPTMGEVNGAVAAAVPIIAVESATATGQKTGEVEEEAEPDTVVTQVTCRSCGNTGIDFMGNPCLCPYSEKARQEAKARDEGHHAKAEGPDAALIPDILVTKAAEVEICADSARKLQLPVTEGGKQAVDQSLLAGADAGAGDHTPMAQTPMAVAQEEPTRLKPPLYFSPGAHRHTGLASIPPRGVERWMLRHQMGPCKKDSTVVSAVAMESTPSKQSPPSAQKTPASSVASSSGTPKPSAHSPVRRCPSPAKLPASIPPRGVEQWLQKRKSPRSASNEAAIRRSPTPSRNTGMARGPLPKRRLSLP
mmetsp:Transcript_38497/g.71237  ORF Transcript_38497/g.71237 Transcript_38497/m.71237 type:complete len:464 (-) Transcript_38497:90-1481(-)